MPDVFDLSVDPSQPPIYNQGELGSCTAQAIASAIQFERRDQKAKKDFIPSRLFIYFNERVMEGSVLYDSGAMIRDGIKSVVSLGVCDEEKWPYNIEKFTRKPRLTCYKEALKHKTVLYRRVPRDLISFKSAIYERNLVIFGFAVYESFMGQYTSETGVATLPGSNEKLLGGHAVAAVGWNDNTGHIIVRNSWGEGWGSNGFFYLPYEYITNDNLSDDFWVVTRIKS